MRQEEPDDVLATDPPSFLIALALLLGSAAVAIAVIAVLLRLVF
jgi:hypothetical protein